MDGTANRHQRASLGLSYFDSLADGLPLGDPSSLADVDMEEAWKLFDDMQGPQCVGQDQAALGIFRTSHDDLCAHPPKCPTAAHLLGGYGGNASSHMLFHTRHYDPQAMAGRHTADLHSFSALAHTNVLNLVDLSSSALLPHNIPPAAGAPKPAFAASSVGTPFAHLANPDSPATQSALHAVLGQGAQQPALSSAPAHRSMREGHEGCAADDDAESTCDSDCGAGQICYDAACDEDPLACCEDETCLLPPTLPPSPTAITSEDAIAAAALASFIDQQAQASQQQMMAAAAAAAAAAGMHGHHHQGHSSHSLSSAAEPSCLRLGLGPDVCISPNYLTSFEHLRDAHNPLAPSVCRESFCPVNDPSFYQECHVRDLPQNPHQRSFFDGIDLSLMMGDGLGPSHHRSDGHSHDHSHVGATECGARFPSAEAMIQHLWNEHALNTSLLQLSTADQDLQLDQTPGMDSSASSSASLASQDLTRTPSLVTMAQNTTTPMSLSDSALPLPAYGFGRSLDSSPQATQAQRQHDTIAPLEKQAIQLQFPLGALDAQAAQFQHSPEQDHANQNYACLWCDTLGGQPCSLVFESAGELHRHVLDAHTHSLKRDLGGTYSCGWLGCTRRDSGDKGGFAQKSKVDRHMQVHTGNKPFTCDVCQQSFSANQALLQHKLIHQDSKPLSCDICGKTFRQHSALTMHIRTHTKVRPLKCPYCNKEFSESSNLSKHKRIHTGDGQYECKFPGCNRTFHRKDQLRRHSAQHSKSLSSAVMKPSSNSSAVVRPSLNPIAA